MATLSWVGRDAVIDHHERVESRPLQEVPDLACGDATSGNLIIQGDNLLALKALLPEYAGKVKCLYVDPPYNTGTEGWVYNDRVDSPAMREWLGNVSERDLPDMDRRDRWLSMMYPRLRLAKELLSPRWPGRRLDRRSRSERARRAARRDLRCEEPARLRAVARRTERRQGENRPARRSRIPADLSQWRQWQHFRAKIVPPAR